MDRFQLFRELLNDGLHRKMEQLKEQSKVKAVVEKLIGASKEE